MLIDVNCGIIALNRLYNIAMNSNLINFGINFERAGIHTRRTIMIDDLTRLLDYSDGKSLSPAEYKELVVDENCLGKNSVKTRTLSYQYLADTYLLDPDIVLFRALLYFWQRDEASSNQLAMLCAYNRDALFRMVTPYILSLPEGTLIQKVDVEEFIESAQPDRFSQSTLESTVRNLNSSFTQSGHLQGRVKKVRTRIEATPASVSYALLLGYIRGLRGEILLNSEYLKLLECSFDQAVELASVAARRGWIVFKQIGNVVEVAFPNILTSQDMEALREQN